MSLAVNRPFLLWFALGLLEGWVGLSIDLGVLRVNVAKHDGVCEEVKQHGTESQEAATIARICLAMEAD